MYPATVARPAAQECEEALATDQGYQTPTDVYRAPQRSAPPTRRAKRCRTNTKRRGTSAMPFKREDMSTLRTSSQCGQSALDVEIASHEADLDNLIQVNQLLRRVQTKAHKDLSFVQGRIAQYHEGFRQLEAQNHHLQQAILTMSAQLDGLHGLNGVQVQAPGQDAVNGQDADGSSDHEESSEELLHIHFSEKM